MNPIVIKATYMDGKEVRMNLPEEECKAFFESINQNTVYWNKSETHGFWTDLSKIRYLQVEKKLREEEPCIEPGSKDEEVG